ncbi:MULTISPECIES: acetyl-CoA carboxylase biotin carboxyl carrier protein subunit [Limnochorda]|uniref:acetyl-CoA carboxylase biotin carboxyl carrier protein subunit n=1 Tax=Limnochorda TaxID=1676651 RepID=UPI0017DC78C3|nr:acetyl-CoA carboxylase biotin carboxyl carrier protein subunit [Limnochorda pilosa]MBO2486280.1 acetyl-CoA carboxylase biotin carboxyl carrier protein subunit [Bacillota bacterium]MBO2519911.1 acetyl-CoA carboxylase biotin carboxyl carrier protein subunit [Bacillota bacterium]NMA71567.1 acetyl-CoA carboxylase biotin carboxyl carrier protein subunit [Bacillota bacterium]
MKSIASEMAGILLDLKVAVGDQVQAGQEVAVIESMKMHIPLNSPEGGVVRAIHAQPGQFVNAGDLIVELE